MISIRILHLSNLNAQYGQHLLSFGGAVFSAIFFGLVLLTILLAGVGLFMHKFSLAIICLPLVFIPLFLLSYGVSWFVASLGVYVRDSAHVIGIVLQMLVFVTPVLKI